MFTLPYRSGTLRAAGIENGQEVETRELSTASEAYGIRLTADRSEISADGQDLSFVTVEIVDREGNVVPQAGDRVSFELKGEGILAAVGNADLKDEDSYVGNSRKVWKGRAILVVKSTRESGTIRIKASAPGLRSSSATIKTR